MLTLSISQLRAQNKPLIRFSNPDSFSTYTDARNMTLTPGPLIVEFESLVANSAEVRGKPFTNL